MRWLLGLLLFGLAAPGGAVALRTEVVAGKLRHPWSLAFLPEGGVLVTERSGRLLRIAEGRVTPVAGLPRVFASGQGGLFDVRLHPDFATNRLLYLSYAHGSSRANATRVARARLEGDRLRNLEVIWTATPMKRRNVHFGGRLAFLPDATLLVTTGDGFDFREEAQRLGSPLGKVMRLTADGRPAPGNPFTARPGAQSAIWTLGHRNPQGLAFDPVRRLVYLHEHGPRGGDELNILEAGHNYGWPVATRGRDYSGATISPYRRYPGMTEPLLDWTPSIAPSGLVVYRGAMFPEWQGDLLLGALASRELRRIRLSPDGRRVLGQDSLLKSAGARIREVAVAPDGALWVTTDAPDGQLLRISRR
ncbi:PQQ-dependent sugar dehydrogenase [Thermaurantiacus sp.]